MESDGPVIKGLGADFDSPDAEADNRIWGAQMRCGVLFKMVVTSDIGWLPREVTLTDRSVYISEVGQTKYLDFIPLLDVTRVSRFSSTNGLQSSAPRAGPSEPAKAPEAFLRSNSNSGRRSSLKGSRSAPLHRHKLDHGSKVEASVPGVGKDSPSWSSLEGDSAFLFVKRPVRFTLVFCF